MTDECVFVYFVRLECMRWAMTYRNWRGGIATARKHAIAQTSVLNERKKKYLIGTILRFKVKRVRQRIASRTRNHPGTHDIICSLLFFPSVSNLPCPRRAAISAFLLFVRCCRDSMPASLTHAMMQSGHSALPINGVCVYVCSLYGVRNTKQRSRTQFPFNCVRHFLYEIRLLWWCRVVHGIWHCCRRMLTHEFLFSIESTSKLTKKRRKMFIIFVFVDWSIELLGGAIERYRIDAQYIFTIQFQWS